MERLCNSPYQFLLEEIEFLGHVVTAEGVKADPKKIQAIEKLEYPTDGSAVRSFLGMAGYYRRFIENFAKRTASMRALTKNDATFNFTQKCKDEFDSIKKSLISQPVMAFPDFNRKFILTTDASKDGYGAILSQLFPEGERVVAYASKSTTPGEKNYSATELEDLRDNRQEC